MSDYFNKTLEIALEHVGKHAGEAAMYKRLFEQMAYCYYRTVSGDDVQDEAFEIISDHNLVDEDGEWIYGEDE